MHTNLYIYICIYIFILYNLYYTNYIYIYMQLYKFIHILYNFGIGVMWAVLFCSDKMWLCNIWS